jgi:hypothetical protein
MKDHLCGKIGEERYRKNKNPTQPRRQLQDYLADQILHWR